MVLHNLAQDSCSISVLSISLHCSVLASLLSQLDVSPTPPSSFCSSVISPGVLLSSPDPGGLLLFYAPTTPLTAPTMTRMHSLTDTLLETHQIPHTRLDPNDTVIKINMELTVWCECNVSNKSSNN